MWIAPESQDPELIWPGWDTETIPAGALKDDVVDLTLVAAHGPAAGTPIWQIPQTQKAGVVWLGWNTEELTAAQVYGGGVDWRLDKVTGPGALAIFEFDSFGQPKIIFNSADGLPDTYRIPLGTHAHGNWAFTKAGTYRLTLTHSATLANGKAVSDTATLTFIVGPPAEPGRSTTATLCTSRA